MSREADRPLNTEQTSHFEEATARDRGMGLVSKMKERATEVGESMRRQRESAAGGLDRFASTIRDKADSIPGGRRASRAAYGIADCMESTASYLRDHDLKAMGDDLVQVCRKHPGKALISAVAAGFILGRVARRGRQL